MPKLVVFCVFATLIVACGKKDKKDDRTGSDQPTSMGIVGDWQGHMQILDDEDDVKENYKVSLNFDKERKFLLKSPQDESLVVAGDYFQQNQNFIMTVEQSTFSLLATENPIVEYSYFLAGDVLRLENKSLKFLLKRDKLSLSEAGPSTTHSQWVCNVEDIEIDLRLEGDYFKMKIRAKNKRMVYLEGVSQTLAESSWSLTTQLSNEESWHNSQFQLNATGGMASLQELTKGLLNASCRL